MANKKSGEGEAVGCAFVGVILGCALVGGGLFGNGWVGAGVGILAISVFILGVDVWEGKR